MSAPAAARRRRGGLERSEARAGLAFLSPTVLVILLVVVAPVVWTVVMAFQDIRLVTLATSGLAGEATLRNVREVLTSDGFWGALGTTLAYSVLGTGSAVGLGLVGALALRGAFRGRGLVRGALLLPYVAPVVAATFVWGVLLNPQLGVVNQWGTTLLGWDEPVAFLSQRTSDVDVLGATVPVPTALLSVVVVEAWRSFPFALLFLTARLEAVPATLEEAARVDGATPTQRFRHVLLPQLLPTIGVLVLLRFIWTFTSFDEIYLLTGGGAGTEVLSVRVFDYLVARGDVGAASAQALVLALVLAVLVVAYLRAGGARDEEEA